MTFVESLFSKPLFQAVGWALIHFIWQGTLVAMILSSANIFLKNASANARYVAACGALFLMLALPVATAISYYAQPVELPFSVKSPPMVASDIAETSGQPTQAIRSEGILPETGAGPAQAPTTSLLQSVKDRLIYLMPWFVAIWAVGVFALSLRFIGGLAMMRKMRQSETNTTEPWLQERVDEICAQIRISRPVVVCQSLLVEVPTVIGWLKPMILLPASSLMGLSTQQLEALLVHELAHIRRYDYLVNILQTTVETLLFYHPAVWWASQQVREEREHCCDDLAVSVCGDVLVYARALADLEQLRAAGPGLAMGANGGTLLRRIQRLIGSPAPASRSLANWIAGLVAGMTVFALLASAHTATITNKIKEIAAVEVKSANTAKIVDSSATSSRPATTPAKKKIEDATVQQTEPTITTPATESGRPQNNGTAQHGDFIDELAAAGYTNLTVDELIALKNSGVTPEFIRAMNEANGGKLSVRELINLRNVGVTSEYVSQLRALGFTKLTPRELNRLAVHGVNADYIRGLSEAGYKNLTSDELVNLSIHGVNAQSIKELKNAGYDNLSVDDLVAMSIHGVSPQFIKEMKALGYDNLSAGQLSKLTIHGITSTYVKAMRDLGYNLTLDQLVAFSIHGITPQLIKRFEDEGYTNLSSEDLVDMSIHGITPEYIKGLKEAGYSNLRPRELVRLGIHGVTPEFIRKAANHGFRDLRVEQLIKLSEAGIF
ncbi:MAG TPA: M56 family metallopeptidase [Blastocatellia bacterium]|nr:M56 family metallopeptidase [Blastocatellia bacterium]